LIREVIEKTAEGEPKLSMHVAIIGGHSLDLSGEERLLHTPYGDVQARYSFLGDKELLFVPRHGSARLPPHRVNYRAIMWAIRSQGVSRAISMNTVGSSMDIPPGSYFIPEDFVEFTHGRINTFYEDRAVHIDMSEPYCPQIRKALKEGANAAGYEARGGVYICSQGPHLESPAQIRAMMSFGNVVGMTGYPEVVLARELGLCYASLCLVTNYAAGLSKDRLSVAEIFRMVEQSRQATQYILRNATERLPEHRECCCKDALLNSEI
jgi:5'-methylthioadenosine phosphorylase